MDDTSSRNVLYVEELPHKLSEPDLISKNYMYILYNMSRMHLICHH